MPIPQFAIDGIIPPWVDPKGPGGNPAQVTPYLTTAAEMASRFGTTLARQKLLAGWLGHRRALRNLGLTKGFQWIDGSFVENKHPRDIDTVTFFHRPQASQTGSDIKLLFQTNPSVFDRTKVRTRHGVDAFFIDLGGSPDFFVRVAAYYLGLFSHRRGDIVWKGILLVPLAATPSEDQAAAQLLKQVGP